MGLCGIGGSALLLPMLKHSSLSQFQINATIVAALMPTSLVGAAAYSTFGCANFAAASTMIAAAIPMSKVGIAVGASASDKVMKRLVAGVVLASIPATLRSWTSEVSESSSSLESIDVTNEDMLAKVGSQYVPDAFNSGGKSSKDSLSKLVSSLPFYLLLGASSGLLTGLAGIGGGLVMTLGLSSFASMSQQEVVGTSLLALIPTLAFTTAQNFKRGNIELRLASLIGAGSVIGLLATANIAVHAPESQLRQIFALVCAYSAVDLLRASLRCVPK